MLPELPDTKCPVCDREYQSFERQMRHIFELHQDYWQIFSGGRPLDVFIRQREIKHREKRFSCDICKKYYSHETGYLKHMATHPEMSNLKMTFWTCQVCQKVFTKLSFLERHMEMKSDEAHKRALVDYKFSNSSKLRGDIAAAAGSAATQGVSTSGQQILSAENSINTASGPVFPTANSVVTSAIEPKVSDMRSATSQCNSWKGHGTLPLLNTHAIDSQAQVSFSSVPQFNNGVEKTEQTLSQPKATFSSMSAANTDVKSGNTSSTNGTKEINTINANAKQGNRGCDSNAEENKKAILSVPQGLSPTANLASQFPPNAINPRLGHDGMFPAVSSSYRPMTPLEQLALAGSSMMHNPALVPGFPMRSGHMAVPPMSTAGMVTAHSHLPIPRLPDPCDQEDIASALQSIANQVNTSK